MGRRVEDSNGSRQASALEMGSRMEASKGTRQAGATKSARLASVWRRGSAVKEHRASGRWCSGAHRVSEGRHAS